MGNTYSADNYGCTQCQSPLHANTDKTGCVECPTGIYVGQNGCQSCGDNLVPDNTHDNCVECDLPTGQEIQDSTGIQRYATSSGPGYRSNDNNTSCYNPKCTIPPDIPEYVIIDNEGLFKDEFNPTISCSPGYAGTTPNASPCLNYGEGITSVSGCYPQNIFNENSKCGDFLTEPVNFTEKCNGRNSIVLENKSCDTLEKCISSDYCCSPNVSNNIKQLNHEIYFSDSYELIDNDVIDDNPVRDFNAWYDNINTIIQGIQNRLDSGDLTDTPQQAVARQQAELDRISLKNDILNSFQEDGKYYNKGSFEDNWIGSGGGQEETARDVWNKLIKTINLNKSDSSKIDAGSGDLSSLTGNDLKLLLINLDKPIRNTDGTFKYPIGTCSDTSIIDEASCTGATEIWTPGLSPLDLFLYNDDEGITASQLEALL